MQETFEALIRRSERWVTLALACQAQLGERETLF